MEVEEEVGLNSNHFFLFFWATNLNPNPVLTLLLIQLGTGKKAPTRNSETKFLYNLPGPNNRIGPIGLHITEGWKMTLCFSIVSNLCR